MHQKGYGGFGAETATREGLHLLLESSLYKNVSDFGEGAFFSGSSSSSSSSSFSGFSDSSSSVSAVEETVLSAEYYSLCLSKVDQVVKYLDGFVLEMGVGFGYSYVLDMSCFLLPNGNKNLKHISPTTIEIVSCYPSLNVKS
jgi:hypothetical protein